MAFRPGLTGMWQVSGRSNITDFEEVVKLDTEYINEWSLRLDLPFNTFIDFIINGIACQRLINYRLTEQVQDCSYP